MGIKAERGKEGGREKANGEVKVFIEWREETAIRARAGFNAFCSDEKRDD